MVETYKRAENCFLLLAYQVPSSISAFSTPLSLTQNVFHPAQAYCNTFCAAMAVQVSAAPTADTVEIIPGPGLPSLQSLGLTSVDIFRTSAERSITARNEVETSLTKRIPTTCQNIAGHTVSAANAAACVTFLRNLGTQACGVSGDNIIFCQAGDAAIWGSNVGGGPSGASSFCSDVAIGAQNILNACTMSNGQVEGFAAANGNGDLMVSIEPLTGA